MPAWLDWVTLRPFDQVSKGMNNCGLGEGEWGIMKITDNLSVVTLGKFRQLCNIWWFEVKQIQYFCLKICVCISNYNLVPLACEFGWSLVILKSELQVECVLTALQMRWLWIPRVKFVIAVISLPAELILLTPPTVSRKHGIWLWCLLQVIVIFFSGVKLTLSALIDGKNFNAGGHKVGLGFELDA